MHFIFLIPKVNSFALPFIIKQITNSDVSLPLRGYSKRRKTSLTQNAFAQNDLEHARHLLSARKTLAWEHWSRALLLKMGWPLAGALE